MKAVRMRNIKLCLIAWGLYSASHNISQAEVIDLNSIYRMTVDTIFQAASMGEALAHVEGQKLGQIREHRNNCSHSNDNRFVRVLVLKDDIRVFKTASRGEWLAQGSLVLKCQPVEQIEPI